VDDITFAARRATSSTSRTEADAETRFRVLVQSPLRAGILRFLSARPTEQFDAEGVMQAFGRMRLDVENCLKELVDSGVVRRVSGDPLTYTAARVDPTTPMGQQLDNFLERRAAVGIEDTSPSVQRFREMIGRDEKMLAIFEWIRTAAKSDISVLILGPTGRARKWWRG
jgi:transcriptional regulator with AAA-type ATPase domain